MPNEVYTASHNRPYSGPLPPPSVLIRLAVHSLAVLTTDNMHTAMTEHESRHLLYSIIIIIITARCTLVQSAVLRSHVVCLSVCNVGEL